MMVSILDLFSSDEICLVTVPGLPRKAFEATTVCSGSKFDVTKCYGLTIKINKLFCLENQYIMH